MTTTSIRRFVHRGLTAAVITVMMAACSAPDAAQISDSTRLASSAHGVSGDQTPAQQRIAAAEAAVRARPGSYEAYNELALAFARRARETADTKFYTRAEEAIATSLQLAPDNFDALKMRTWVLLGKHEFRAALDLAKALNKQMPDDLLVYGFLTDAHVELGEYKEAEEACQWMLDLRPGNIPAFTRAAYLRELFGDLEGAVELMAKAYDRTPPAEAEDRAWTLTQVAHLTRLAGNVAEAERLLVEALKLFPNYHYALAQLAKIRTAEGRHGEAATLLQQRYDAAPHPENLYDLARALRAAGRTSEARTAFARFEQLATAESEKWDNANRELTFYYLDVAKRPEEGLRIASLEIARRQDVHTLDAYAWALHANKRTAEARDAMRRALDVGVVDPEIRARAKSIGL